MALLYEKEGRVVTITINRPEALNAFDPETTFEFSEATIKFRDDRDAWVAIITGAGDRSFSAGADLKKLVPARVAKTYEPPPMIMSGIEIWKPMIAAVNGTAFGGGLELALACDLRIAAEHALFGLPEVKWGLIPGWGGTQRLHRLIPWARALEMLLTGEPIDAQEALRLGLVNSVVPKDKVVSTAREWADKICKNGPLAVRAAKEAMARGANMNLDDGLKLEFLLADHLVTDTEDAVEGPKAFVEKRTPDFKAR
ncbi:enoyl-CoA hydratase/isomerase family protein [Chloroflexota bacterium]